jgi:UrcA family protein
MIQLRPFRLLAGALCVAVAAQAAAAQGFVLRHGAFADPSEPGKVVREAAVTRSDIDPNSPEGAQAMLQRIEAAADAVCGGAANAVTERQKDDYLTCRGPAVSNALARLHAPAVTALASRRQAERHAER